MTNDIDIISDEARQVLDVLGNTGAIARWYAVDWDNEPIEPDDAQPGGVDPNSVIVVWHDETATLITTAYTEDPGT